jgi:predicted Zn-dependent protease
LVPSCAVNPVTGKKQLVLVSESQELAMGAQYDPEIASTYGVYNDPNLLKLVTTDGEAIGKISHRPNLQYHFRILDTPVINAFAVPGGYIYVTRGILAQFNNEAELAGVLGHEIGHVAARHTVEQITKEQFAQLGLAVGMIASEDFRKFAGIASQGMQLLFLRFSRDNERQSDKLGVEYATKKGFDTHEMANFFQVLQKMQIKDSPAGIPTFLSTHPDPGDRFNAVNKMTKEWQDSLKTGNWKVNQDSYLKLLDGLVYGEDPRQGYVENNIFYHPVMKFRFPVPAGWTLANSPLQVQISPSDGKAMIIFAMAQQTDLDSAATQTMKNLNLSILNTNRTTVNGMPALCVLSEQVNQDQQTGQKTVVKALSNFISYNGSTYVFHGVANETDFSTFYQLFESTMGSFNKLSDPQKINVQPKRIKIVAVQRTGTLNEVLTGLKMSQTQMDNLALLNNLALTSQVEKGKLIKIIQ